MSQMDRLAYLIRRLLLVIPTFLGVTVLCFALTRFLPGGPVEMRLMRLKGLAAGASAAQTTVQGGRNQISEEYRQQLERQYGFDRPLVRQYWDWLVTNRVGLNLPSYDFPDKTAWQLIRSRLPVSVWFGHASLLLTYLVCIPLGIAKALRHRQVFDMASSVIVFVAYAIPSFALAMILKMAFCGATEGLFDIFPIGGLVSDFDIEPSFWTAVADRVWHMVLPIACYVAGSFAMLTILMKNSLLDQISADYVRTVIAKGATRRRAIWGHAFRNALIPIVTGLGPMIGFLFAGSMIIETIFEIPGMGRLGWDALVGRDYAVFLALLALTAGFQLIGNLLSDILYMIIDPRVSFSGRNA